MIFKMGFITQFRRQVQHFSSVPQTIRIVLISDTHSRHDALGSLPHGDVLLHAGDFTRTRPSTPQEYTQFVDWFASQPHQHKVLISGNRDGFMDTTTSTKYQPQSVFWMKQVQDYVKNNRSFVYLEDSTYKLKVSTNCDAKVPCINIFGSPWTGIYGKPGKAFQIQRELLKDKWRLIPDHTHILITHMPPHGLRDGRNSGSKSLLDKVKRVQPSIHVFGHIHEGYGVQEKNGTMFVNAASVRSGSKSMNPPIVLEYDSSDGSVKRLEDH